MLKGVGGEVVGEEDEGDEEDVDEGVVKADEEDAVEVLGTEEVLRAEANIKAAVEVFKSKEN